MTINDLCNKIEEFEGFRAQAYICPAGVPTIGFGRTEGVNINMTTNIETERKWLHNYVDIMYTRVKNYCNNRYNYNFNENQLLALTDFAFNLGFAKLTQLTASGTRTPKVIASKILEYDKARVNGVLKPLKGLTARRKWEYDLFTSNMELNTNCEPNHTISEIQDLCNKIKPNLNKLTVDGIMGKKTINRVYTILYDLL